jgi:hypothetical protein
MSEEVENIDAFFESFVEESLTKRFHMFAYSKDEIGMYKNAVSKAYDKSSKAWNKRHPETPRLFGEQLMATLPCRCHSVRSSDGDGFHMECPVCLIKRLRRDEDDRVAKERMLAIKSKSKRSR